MPEVIEAFHIGGCHLAHLPMEIHDADGGEIKIEGFHHKKERQIQQMGKGYGIGIFVP